MKRALIIAILLSFVHYLSFAQAKKGQARLDSLLAEVPKMKEDANGILLMNFISNSYNHINPDEGLRWAEKQLVLAQKIGSKNGEADAYNALGTNYYNKGAFPLALDAYFKSLHIAEELNNPDAIGNACGNIGNVYVRQKEFSKALEYHSKALKVAEKKHDKWGIMVRSGNIANVYEGLNNAKEALIYRLKSLRMAEEMNEMESIITMTGNVGTSYTNLKQYNLALSFILKALRMAIKTGDNVNTAINLGNAGENYYLIAINSPAPHADSLVAASRPANLANAVDYLTRGIAACREVQLFGAIPEFFGYLSDAFIAQGDYKNAIAAYKQSVQVNDSLHNIANNEAIASLETKRAVELKDKDIQIEKLKKRNERMLFAGGFAVLLLIMGILYRNFRRQQHSNRLLSKEKKRSDDLLLNILPAEVAEELKNNGASAAKQYDEVSVLFTDFVDFTGTAEKLSPQQLVRELNECFTAFDAIIERNGLEKIKTIGDAYMAVSGLPVSDPRHAQKTVQAAIEIRNFIEERKKHERVFQIRIGINSGPVVAGIVGVKKFAYDIWGDTVNTANRMEQHGAAGSINISQSTWELVKNDYNCEYRGKIVAKNKGEIEMYFVGGKY